MITGMIAELSVPSCWKELIKIAFSEDLKGITSEKHCSPTDSDPRPHYDDFRSLKCKFEDDTEFTLCLASGQGNYYGWCEWATHENETHGKLEDIEVYEDIYETVLNNTEYTAQIRWV